MKELGYDIKNDVRLSYEDCEGVSRIISDDQSIVGFTKQLVAQIQQTFMLSTWVPEILLPAFGFDSDSDNSDEGNNDDDEVLVDVLFMDLNLDDDKETEQARDEIRKYVT